MTSVARARAAVAGFFAVGVALWFASSWIDQGDSTCGSLWRTELWADRCASTMYPRLLVSLPLGILGAYLVGAAVLRTTRWRAGILASVAVVGSTVAIIENEFVRSGGLFG